MTTDTHNNTSEVPVTITIDTVYPSCAAAADAGMSLGRCGQCHNGRKVYAWKSGAARIGDLSCPTCGGALATSTRMMQAPAHAFDVATVKAIAKANKAAVDAKVDARVAAGVTIRAKDLKVGDVVHYGHDWVKVVAVGGKARAKSHAVYTVARRLDTIEPVRYGRTEITFTLSAPPATELPLLAPGRNYTFATDEQVEAARRVMAGQIIRAEDEVESFSGAYRYQYDNDEQAARREEYRARMLADAAGRLTLARETLAILEGTVGA